MAEIARGATSAGTRRYADRMIADGVVPEHYRTLDGLLVSTIGIGTYLGNPDAATDAAYEDAVVRAVELGTNFIDTAINYRFQRSERSIGSALRRLFEAGTVARDELVVATKGGFFPFDGERPADPAAWIQDNVVDAGLATAEDIALGCHCMTPRYLRDQIERSLLNLGVDYIDIYYLHNPETQLSAVDRREFQMRLQPAMAELESAVADGLIRSYGLATWDGFRVAPDATAYLSVEDVVRTARAAVSEGGHHWSTIQLPFNLAMHEAFSFVNQLVAGEPRSTADAASGRGISLVASGSMLQGQLAQKLPDGFEQICPGLDTDAQRALQFTRSAPHFSAALCGMSQVAHVEENLALARSRPIDPELIASLFVAPPED